MWNRQFRTAKQTGINYRVNLGRRNYATVQMRWMCERRSVSLQTSWSCTGRRRLQQGLTLNPDQLMIKHRQVVRLKLR